MTPTDTKPLDLEPIKKRCAGATPEPWVVGAAGVVVHLGDEVPRWWPDSEFIATARSDVPALVAEVERLREIFRMVADDEVSPTSVRWVAGKALAGAGPGDV